MHLADCLMELVCHARWLAQRSLSFVDPAMQEQYQGDMDAAVAALQALSKPMNHVEQLSEIPTECLDILTKGHLYLLVGETILGHAPPTMHPFLQQAEASGRSDTAQTQLMVVRWFNGAGVVSADEMYDMVFGADASQQSLEQSLAHSAASESALERQRAVAEHLAEADPFYLGAHITLMRGLLGRYCQDLITVHDIQGHVVALGGDTDAVPVRTMEDALLLWVRTVVRLLTDTGAGEGRESSPIASVLDVSRVNDLYLHTNDGRLLSLVIHRYRPDLLDASAMHALDPLTVWQRQDNWSSVIRAAEGAGLWIGFFPEEMVAQGFTTLQLHALRIVEELFVVLGGDAERALEQTGVDLEMRADTEYVTVSQGALAVARSQAIRSSFHRVTTPSINRVPDAFDTPADLVADTDDTVTDVIRASYSHSALPSLAQSPAPCMPIGGSPAVGASVQDVTASTYSVVMASLVLRGVGIPLEQSPEEDDVGSLGRPDKRDASLAEVSPLTEDHSPPRTPGGDTDRVATPPQPALAVEVTSPIRCGVSPGRGPPSPGKEPLRSVSPVVPRRGSARARTARGARRRQPQHPVVASVAHFKAQRPVDTETRTGTSLAGVVQGSIDAEGIEDLLAELAEMGQAERPANPTAAPGTNLRLQNLALQQTLEQQQQRIHAVIGKLRRGIRRREVDAIADYLKGKKAAGPSPTTQEPTAPAVAPPAEEVKESAPEPMVFNVPLHASQTQEDSGLNVPKGNAQLERLKRRHEQRRRLGGLNSSPLPDLGATAAPATTASESPVPAPPAPAAQDGPTKPQAGLKPLRRMSGVPAVPPVVTLSKRNNRQVVSNALRHVCLTGPVNKAQLDHALGVMDDGDAAHYVVLLKDEYQKAFRGLYLFRGTNLAHRVFGAGPLTINVTPRAEGTPITSDQPSRMFKFDTGSKRFAQLPSTSFNEMTDAVTLPPRTRCGPPAL